MVRRPSNFARLFAIALAVFSLLNLAIGLFLSISRPITPSHIAAGFFQFFRFFTNLTNILALLVVTAHAWPRLALRFFKSPRVAAAVAGYMLGVDLIYALLLRSQWHPFGIQRVVDINLHDVLPVLYFLFWILIIPKGLLRWRDAWVWLIYPIAFVFYNVLCSAVSGSNPYPFLDLQSHRWPRVMANMGGLTLLFLIIGLSIIAIHRAVALTRHRQPDDCS